MIRKHLTFAFAAAVIVVSAAGCGGGSGSGSATPFATARAAVTPTPVAPTPVATAKPSASPTVKPSPTPTSSPTPATLISVIAQYPLGVGGAPIEHPAFAGDGNLWFATSAGLSLYSVTTAGAITAHPSAYAGTAGTIVETVAGPDGSIYYVVSPGDGSPNQIRKMTVAGIDSTIATPPETCITAIAFNATGTTIYASSYVGTTPGSSVYTCGETGAPMYRGSIVVLNLQGSVISNETLPTSTSQGGPLAVGADKRIWTFATSVTNVAQIVAEAPDGTLTAYTIASQPAAPALALGPYSALYYAAVGDGTLAEIDEHGVAKTQVYPGTGTLVDVARDANGGISFVAAPASGATTSTLGVYEAGAKHVTSALPNIADAIAPGPDGDLYVFEHPATSQSTEMLAKVAILK